MAGVVHCAAAILSWATAWLRSGFRTAVCPFAGKVDSGTDGGRSCERWVDARDEGAYLILGTAAIFRDCCCF
jgi:hypothetical protein